MIYSIYLGVEHTPLSYKNTFVMYGPLCILYMILVGVLWYESFISCVLSVVFLVLCTFFIVWHFKRMVCKNKYVERYNTPDYIVGAIDIWTDFMLLPRDIMAGMATM